MAEEQDQGEKSFEPTPKRLEDARKKGEVPRSLDLVTSGAYGGLVLALAALGLWSVSRFGSNLVYLLENASVFADQVFQGGASSALGGALLHILWASTPIFVAPAALALLMILGQRSLIFTGSKIQPKLSRISPLSNAKQKFGTDGLVQFMNSFIKMALFTAALWFLLIGTSDRILILYRLSPEAGLGELGQLVLYFLVLVLVISLGIGVLDYLWQRHSHLKKHMMSRKDLQDEAKSSEGDPHMKQQRRQKGMQLAMGQMMAEVPKADVIVVNPTHFAVALAWDRGSAGAPICVAKGVDHIALKIRQIAQTNNVPIHSDPPTARALFAQLDIGDEIEPEFYQAVAAAIRFADMLRKKAK